MGKDINQALKEWQEALRLQDWDITAEVLSKTEYESKVNKDTAGWVDIDRVHLKATIKLLDDESLSPLEYQLVHELSHILVDPFNAFAGQAVDMAPGTPAQDILDGSRRHELEIMVHRIARALLMVRDMAQGTPAEPERPEITE
jgi:hypothetical protein